MYSLQRRQVEARRVQGEADYCSQFEVEQVDAVPVCTTQTKERIHLTTGARAHSYPLPNKQLSTPTARGNVSGSFCELLE